MDKTALQRFAVWARETLTEAAGENDRASDIAYACFCRMTAL